MVSLSIPQSCIKNVLTLINVYIMAGEVEVTWGREFEEVGGRMWKAPVIEAAATSLPPFSPKNRGLSIKDTSPPTIHILKPLSLWIAICFVTIYSGLATAVGLFSRTTTCVHTIDRLLFLLYFYYFFIRIQMGSSKQCRT